jgi:hypothetical protein
MRNFVVRSILTAGIFLLACPAVMAAPPSTDEQLLPATQPDTTANCATSGDNVLILHAVTADTSGNVTARVS